MFFILLALVITAIFHRILIRLSSVDLATVLMLLTFFIMIILIPVGIFVPVKGYTEPKAINETELVSLSNSTASSGDGLIFITVSANNVYSYRYEIDSKFAGEDDKAYEVKTLDGGKKYISEVESKDIETAKLVQYVSRGKMSFWSFALERRTDYVFYVPEGTISREIALK